MNSVVFFVFVLCSSVLRSHSVSSDFVKRDPFMPTKTALKQKTNLSEQFNVTQLKLVAIMSGIGAAKAMLVAPNGESFIVKKGDKIGKRGGRVSKLLKHELVIREEFVSPSGEKKTSSTSLFLAM